MTQVDVVYKYGARPSETSAMALGSLREVYGIRKVDLREAEQTVCVEYDSTRLTEPVVRQLLRRTGLDITDQVVLTRTPPPPAVVVPAS